MRKAHKRWKQKMKAEDEKRQIASDAVTDELKAMLYFLKKHPDQAAYEIELSKEQLAV